MSTYTLLKPENIDKLDDRFRSASFKNKYSWFNPKSSEEIEVYTFQELSISEVAEMTKIVISHDTWIKLNSIKSVTPRQMRSALFIKGITSDFIESMINTLSSPNKELSLIAWEYSLEFQRSNPLLVAMAPALNLTDTDLDELFILASTL